MSRQHEVRSEVTTFIKNHWDYCSNFINDDDSYIQSYLQNADSYFNYMMSDKMLPKINSQVLKNNEGPIIFFLIRTNQISIQVIYYLLEMQWMGRDILHFCNYR